MASRLLGSSFMAWSFFRGIGNSSIARATIIVPVIGYLLILNSDFVSWVVHSDASTATSVRPHVSLLCTKAWRLVAIYYGLTCIGVATALFGFMCPFMHRKYGDSMDYALGVKDIFKSDQSWSTLVHTWPER